MRRVLLLRHALRCAPETYSKAFDASLISGVVLLGSSEVEKAMIMSRILVAGPLLLACADNSYVFYISPMIVQSNHPRALLASSCSYCSMTQLEFHSNNPPMDLGRFSFFNPNSDISCKSSAPDLG